MAQPVQRINYHTGLFLEEAEFRLEQNYHLSMRQRLNYALFKPGVVDGMSLDYTGGVLKVTAGMAIDETNDADFGRIGRELVLFQDSDPVSLAGFTSGTTAWITIEYDHSLDAPKAPTNIAARYTQKVKISALHADPGPGTDKILLGQIVIGTNSVTEAVQKASLRLTGAPLPVPTVTSFTPLSGPVGTVVTITGTNFTGATGVSFGGVAAITFTVNSATQLTATVSAGAVTGKIRVTTPAGSGESTTDFTVSALAPTVASFTPTSGGPGTSVTITGTNFTGATAVSFGGVPATTFTVNSATQIAATVPAGAATGKIRVTTPAGFGESVANFTFIPAPTVTNFSPLIAAAGASITVTGTNFTGATGVSFGGVAATTFTVNSATQITATVPAGAVTGKIRVTTPGGFGESAANFTVALPTVTNFAPIRGGGGVVVTITGTNFTGVTGVSFGGVAATTFTVNSATQITATVPVGAVTGRIRITAPAGFGESTTDFTIVPAPQFNALNPFTPRSGFVGNSVSINGTNFNVDSPTPPQVFFGTFAAVVTTFTATSIQVTVPAGGPATVSIRVKTSGGEITSADLVPAVSFNML